MLAGISYAVMIGTESYLLQEMGHCTVTKNKQQKNALLTILCVLALAAFGAAMVWLHYQQLCSPGGGMTPTHRI